MEKLQKWGSDASSIFEGDQLFFDIPVHKDDVYESLLKIEEASLPHFCSFSIKIDK
jgi:hypothetical protein